MCLFDLSRHMLVQAYRSEAEQFQARLLPSETDMSLNTRALHFEHDELQASQLRKSFDDNRSKLLEYVAQELEEKLQSFRETGKFLTLDTKIFLALSQVAKGEKARQIIRENHS